MAYTPREIMLAIIQEGLTARTSGTSETQHPVITPRGIKIALATAIVETNDRDLANPADPPSENLPNDGQGYNGLSDGPFQQQEGATYDAEPSWWGTVTERMTPNLAAAMFYNRLSSLDYNNTANQPGSYAYQVQQCAPEYAHRYSDAYPKAVSQYDALIGEVQAPPAPAPTPVPAPAAPPFVETDMTQNNSNDEDREGYAIKWFILHTEEGGMTGAPFEEWMANNEVSYHYIVNPDGSVIDMETTDVASWSVLDPANEQSINLCFAGSTINWTRQEWLSNMQGGIKSAAYIAVRDCTKYGITVQVLVGPNYPRVVTETGITDHYAITVNQLAPGSTHTDVGPNFPWDVFWGYVQGFLGGTPAPTPVPAPAPAQQTYTVQAGDDLWAIAQQFNTTVQAIEAANPSITNPNLIQPGQVLVIPSS